MKMLMTRDVEVDWILWARGLPRLQAVLEALDAAIADGEARGRSRNQIMAVRIAVDDRETKTVGQILAILQKFQPR